MKTLFDAHLRREPEKELWHQTNVFEIMYEWLNFEVSLAYPHAVDYGKMRPGRKYYTFRECKTECDLINAKYVL